MNSKNDLLTCAECAHWTFKNSIGYCSVRRKTCPSGYHICRLYKPKVTEPEPEQKRTRQEYPYLGSPRSVKICKAIGLFLTGQSSKILFIHRMRESGFTHRPVIDLADQIEQFKEQKPEPAKYPSHCLPPNWRACLDTLRSSYMDGHIDMDVVLAALDPGQTESNVVCDLVSVWEGEKERLRSGKDQLDYLRDMIDTHKAPEQRYGSLEDHKKLSEMYGARRYDKQDFPGDTHEAYIDFGWSKANDEDDDDA